MLLAADDDLDFHNLRSAIRLPPCTRLMGVGTWEERWHLRCSNGAWTRRPRWCSSSPPSPSDARALSKGEGEQAQSPTLAAPPPPTAVAGSSAGRRPPPPPPPSKLRARASGARKVCSAEGLLCCSLWWSLSRTQCAVCPSVKLRVLEGNDLTQPAYLLLRLTPHIAFPTYSGRYVRPSRITIQDKSVLDSDLSPSRDYRHYGAGSDEWAELTATPLEGRHSWHSWTYPPPPPPGCTTLSGLPMEQMELLEGPI